MMEEKAILAEIQTALQNNDTKKIREVIKGLKLYIFIVRCGLLFKRGEKKQQAKQAISETKEIIRIAKEKGLV